MWEIDYKESWAPKNWCFWTVVLKKTLESPLDCKEIQPVHPKGDQSWVFIGRTDAEAEAPILWPPDTKSWLIGKDLDAGKDWGLEKKGGTETAMGSRPSFLLQGNFWPRDRTWVSCVAGGSFIVWVMGGALKFLQRESYTLFKNGQIQYWLVACLFSSSWSVD